MVGIKSFLTSILLAFVLLCSYDVIHAATNTVDVLQTSNMFKGYFGESIADDIWFPTGRVPVTVKIRSATWAGGSGSKHHTVDRTYTQTNIPAGGAGTVDLVIHRYTLETIDSESGTLTIIVDQVD